MEKLIASSRPTMDVLIDRYGMPVLNEKGGLSYQSSPATVSWHGNVHAFDRAHIEIDREYLFAPDRRAKGPFFWDGHHVGRYEWLPTEGDVILWRDPLWPEELIIRALHPIEGIDFRVEDVN